MADSNPLPPDDAGPTSNPILGTAQIQQTLKNDDFRQYLLTPSRGAADGGVAVPQTPSRFAHLDPNAKNRPFAAPKGPIRKKKDHPPKPKTYTIAGSDGSVYVDRAAQRRDGVIPDDKTLDQESDAMMARDMTIEETKYLGGDEEHTHLVKGLDLALFNKVQSEIDEKARQQEEAEKKAAASGPAHFGKQVFTSQDGKVQTIDAQTDFKTLQGRSIYKLFFEQNRPAKSDLFVPGRMAFSFDVDPETISDLPTVVMRAKSDLSEGQGHFVANTTPALIKQVEQIVTYIREGDEGVRKLRRHQKAEEKEKAKETPAAPPPPPRTEAGVVISSGKPKAKPTEPPKPIQPVQTFNIFDDVDDDYVPSKTVETPSMKPKSGANAFGDKMEVEDQLPPMMGPSKPPADDELGPVMGPGKPPADDELGPGKPPADDEDLMEVQPAINVPTPSLSADRKRKEYDDRDGALRSNSSGGKPPKKAKLF